ncbi:hypothetical protein [Arenibacter sp. F20364]|uniref:hypothetical protein n=1 Tax=Arenibacter sp. F20364 TaxID=2926415 RepID=UPI001FF102F8|nr:hypothetical protein [Arenibacter sp. F20364]MCK0189416.1 hypothetical protein [Arenibacter sp. F20364]
MDDRLVPEELRAPITIMPVGTAQMVHVGVVRPFGTVARVQRDTLSVVIYLHRVFSVMDNGFPADMAQ